MFGAGRPSLIWKIIGGVSGAVKRREQCPNPIDKVNIITNSLRHCLSPELFGPEHAYSRLGAQNPEACMRYVSRELETDKESTDDAGHEMLLKVNMNVCFAHYWCYLIIAELALAVSRRRIRRLLSVLLCKNDSS